MNLCVSEQTQSLSTADCPLLSSGPLLKKRSLHVLWWAGWQGFCCEASAVYRPGDLATEVMKGHLNWKIRCFPGHNQLAGRIGIVGLLPALLLESCSSGKILFFEPPPLTWCLWLTLWQSHKSPVIWGAAQAAWGGLKNKLCSKTVLLSREKLLQVWPSGGIMC